MKYRISIFWKMDRVWENHILFVVWNKKFNFKHKNASVIHMLYFCYKKLLIREYVDFSNKWLWQDILWYLVQIGFLIPYSKSNKISSLQEIKLLDSFLHNEILPHNFITSELEVELLKQKVSVRENIEDREKSIDSNFLNFLINRRSTRNFIKNNINYKILIEILQSWLYANKTIDNLVYHWVTPSAWSFYEIDCYIITFKELEWLWKWILKYEKYRNIIIEWENVEKSELLSYWIEKHFENINCMLIFVWYIEYVSEKYWPKAYLYQSLEVWAIQQNITLQCQQNNIWTCILWWYNNFKIRNILNLQEDTFIYSTMLI